MLRSIIKAGGVCLKDLNGACAYQIIFISWDCERATEEIN